MVTSQHRHPRRRRVVRPILSHLQRALRLRTRNDPPGWTALQRRRSPRAGGQFLASKLCSILASAEDPTRPRWGSSRSACRNGSGFSQSGLLRRTDCSLSTLGAPTTPEGSPGYSSRNDWQPMAPEEPPYM
jgi:hypothetical protein